MTMGKRYGERVLRFRLRQSQRWRRWLLIMNAGGPGIGSTRKCTPRRGFQRTVCGHDFQCRSFSRTRSGTTISRPAGLASASTLCYTLIPQSGHNPDTRPGQADGLGCGRTEAGTTGKRPQAALCSYVYSSSITTAARLPRSVGPGPTRRQYPVWRAPTLLASTVARPKRRW